MRKSVGLLLAMILCSSAEKVEITHGGNVVQADESQVAGRTSLLESELGAAHAAVGKLTMAYEKLQQANKARKKTLEGFGKCGPSNCDECPTCPNCC